MINSTAWRREITDLAKTIGADAYPTKGGHLAITLNGKTVITSCTPGSTRELANVRQQCKRTFGVSLKPKSRISTEEHEKEVLALLHKARSENLPIIKDMTSGSWFLEKTGPRNRIPSMYANYMVENNHITPAGRRGKQQIYSMVRLMVDHNTPRLTPPTIPEVVSLNPETKITEFLIPPPKPLPEVPETKQEKVSETTIAISKVLNVIPKEHLVECLEAGALNHFFTTVLPRIRKEEEETMFLNAQYALDNLKKATQ
jgi:hypothetical protein